MSESKLPDVEDKKEYSYEEVHSTPLTDIIPDSQAQPVGEGATVPDKPTEPGDNPADPPKVTPDPDETTTVDDTPNEPDEKTTPSDPVDVEKLASETARKTAEEMVKALVGDDASKADKDETQEKLEAALKDQPWIKENRNPTYAEMARFQIAFVKDIAIEEATKRVTENLQKEVEDEETREKEAATQAEIQAKAFHSKWDSEFDALDKLGHKLDETAKGKIFEIMKSRVLNGKPTDSIIQVFTEDYKPAMDQLEKAKNAPVGGAAHGGASAGGSETYSYAEIHGAKTQDILKEVHS